MIEFSKKYFSNRPQDLAFTLRHIEKKESWVERTGKISGNKYRSFFYDSWKEKEKKMEKAKV